MNIEEITRQAAATIEDVIGETISKICEETIVQYAENNAANISDSQAVRKQIADLVEKFVPNEIGNRLRCGVYDESLVRKVFNNVFDDQMQKALRDQVRREVRSMCKVEIQRYFTKAMDFAKNDERIVELQLEQEDRESLVK